MQQIVLYPQKALAFLLAHRYQSLAAIGIILLGGFFLLQGTSDTETPENGLREVEIIAVTDFAQGATGIAVPTANGNSFIIRAESGGKIIRAASVGAVAQDTLIAQIENTAQLAALTQAEGVYEAAVAATGGNATSQDSARDGGVRAWTTATVAGMEVLRTSIDEYYAAVSEWQGASGFRLEAFGAAQQLNDSRTSIENNILKRWKTTSVTTSNIETELRVLSSELATIGALVDNIAALVPQQPITSVYTEAERTADTGALADARAAITAEQSRVDAARTALANASESGDAAAQAQVKQALGALQAARASYQKTSVRAPFAGTLTSVSVKVGDIIPLGGDVAIIVPKKGVETTRSFALPLSSVKYTPTGAFVFSVNNEGVLESKLVQTGLVTADAIMVTGLNGDEYIVKDVRGLKSGERVAVSE